MTEPRVIAETTLIDTVNGLDLRKRSDGALFVTPAGGDAPLGSAWGPAADRTGNWFAWRAGTAVQRVESRQAAIEYITQPTEEQAR